MSPNHFVARPNVATLNKSLVAVVFFLIFPMIILILLHLFSVCMCVSMCTYLETGRKLSKICSLLPPSGTWDQTQVIQQQEP